MSKNVNFCLDIHSITFCYHNFFSHRKCISKHHDFVGWYLSTLIYELQFIQPFKYNPWYCYPTFFLLMTCHRIGKWKLCILLTSVSVSFSHILNQNWTVLKRTHLKMYWKSTESLNTLYLPLLSFNAIQSCSIQTDSLNVQNSY